jgi:hypothetical protein
VPDSVFCLARSIVDRLPASALAGGIDRSIARLCAGGSDQSTRLPPCWPPRSGWPDRSLARLHVSAGLIELLGRSPPPASSSSLDRWRARMNVRSVEQARRDASGLLLRVGAAAVLILEC